MPCDEFFTMKLEIKRKKGFRNIEDQISCSVLFKQKRGHIDKTNSFFTIKQLKIKVLESSNPKLFFNTL